MDVRQFFEENAEKKDVQVTETGLQYKILKTGGGKQPNAANSVQVHYAGRLLDGSEFDSSYKRGVPAEFPVSGVIAGWIEALQLMKEGSKWEIYIPPELGYGEQGAGGIIPPNAGLIFEVELIKIK